MIKVGFITSPLSSAHSVRGVGFYTKRLLAAMKDIGPKMNIEIIEILHPTSYILHQFDIIHYPYFDLFWHTLPIFKKTKTVVTVHDVIPLEFPDHYPPGLKGALNLELQKLALSSVDRVITVSYSCVKSVHKHLNISHEKIRLIYEAADKKFKPISNQKILVQIKKKYHLPDKFVLYVGDVNWNKNIPGLIQACQSIRLPLVIIGKQAAEIEKMNLNHPELFHLVDHKSLIINHSLRLGFVPDNDLVAIYNLARVYCQPSFAEGFGLPVLEALACGTAVACSQTDPLPELAGEAATYFDPYNVHQMAAAILKAQRPKIKDQKKDEFSWEKTGRETLQVYKEIL